MRKKVLAAFLVVLGILILFSGRLGGKILQKQAKDITQEVREVSAQQMQANDKLTFPEKAESQRFDFKNVRPISNEETWQSIWSRIRLGNRLGTAPLNPSFSGTSTPTSAATTAPLTDDEAKKNIQEFTDSYVIGLLKIPSIDLELGIFKGVLNDNLWVGAGTMRQDQVMGERNYPLAGHKMGYYGVLFNRVPSLPLGAMLYITDKQKIYAYKLYANEAMTAQDIHVIDDAVAEKAGGPVLTLVTCYDLRDENSRSILHAHLVQTTPYSAQAFQNLP
ncbi:Sortase A, LPXTG specific [Clostridiaceae bacterium JG1575]|nr:Sortase A, LPXTG specific [Clostridiaceae bacterium JG1575]